MNPPAEIRILLRAAVSRLRVTTVEGHSSGRDDGAIILGPRVLWAAGLAEFERVEVCDLTRGQRVCGHVRLGTEGEVRIAEVPQIQSGDLVKVSAFAGLPSDRIESHLATLVRVDEHNRVTEFRQVKPRPVEFDPWSFPPLPSIEVVVDLPDPVPVEAMD